MNNELPISLNQSLRVHEWLTTNFGGVIQKATNGGLFSPHLVSAIISQETAYVWLQWLKTHDAATILARCVFDASGDVNHTRKAFPNNTQDFIDRYGQELAGMLIEEANKTRVMRGYAPRKWVYCGYGICQRDIQAIGEDMEFFSEKKWYSFENCLNQCIKELNNKAKIHTDLWDIVKAYNGRGEAATNYANNVFQFMDAIKKATQN